MQKQIIKILQDISEKENLPLYVVEEIYLSQFKFASQVLTSPDNNLENGYKTVKLSFGKFYPSFKKVKKKKEHAERIKNDIDRNNLGE